MSSMPVLVTAGLPEFTVTSSASPDRSTVPAELLALAYLSGVIRGLTLSDTAWAATVGNITSLLGFAVIAGLVSHHLMRQAGASAAAAVELAAARARRAAEESRD